MKKIITEGELVQSPADAHLFYVDDKKRNRYFNLEGECKGHRLLKSHVGQIVTISVEVPEELLCYSPDFEERVLEIVRDVLREAL